MNKKQLAMLEKAFIKEVNAGVSNSRIPGILQTKSKVAAELEKDGYLEFVSFMLPGRFPMKISGYQLTHLGRIT